MDVPEMIAYMVSQVLGGVLGGVCGGVVNSSYSVFAMGDGASHLSAALAEAIFAFILCFVILSVGESSLIFWSACLA